jgi:hypothetical protein
MFLLYHSDRCNTSEMVFHWCYVNDLHTTHTVVCWVTTLHQAIRFTGLVHSSFRLMLHQRQTTFEVRNPRQVLNASASRMRNKRNRRVKHIGRRQPTTTAHRSTSTLTLEGKKTRGNNSEMQSSTTYHKGEVFTKSTEFPDRFSGKI